MEIPMFKDLVPRAVARLRGSSVTHSVSFDAEVMLLNITQRLVGSGYKSHETAKEAAQIVASTVKKVMIVVAMGILI